MVATTPKVAICQPEMVWSLVDHLTTANVALRSAAALGADLVAFPELMLTGIHTKVPEMLDRDAIDAALEAIARLCKALGIAAAIGAPVWGEFEKPFDAYLMFGADGTRISSTAKIRLMPPGEPLVFEAGKHRENFTALGLQSAVVLCREILDGRELEQELGTATQMIFWPGCMARPPSQPDIAIDLARRHRSWIFHSNWARHIEAPQIKHMGRSLVIAPTGEVKLEAPANETGLLLCWLEDSREAWKAMSFTPTTT